MKETYNNTFRYKLNCIVLLRFLAYDESPQFYLSKNNVSSLILSGVPEESADPLYTVQQSPVKGLPGSVELRKNVGKYCKIGN